MSTERMTPEDWIAAAFRRLGKGGIAAVRAEAIARDLRVSKGSFYWHFKDLPDLKARMLEHWLDQATRRSVALAQDAGSDPAGQLARLIEIATSDLADPYGGLSTEAAIRDWARTDPLAATAQAQSDAARLTFVTDLMARAGLERAQATRAARLVVMAYTGAVHHGIRDRAELAGDLAHLLRAVFADLSRTAPS